MLRYLIAQNVSVQKKNDFGESAAKKAIGCCPKCLEELLNADSLVSEFRIRDPCVHNFVSEDRCQDNFTLAHFAAKQDDLIAMELLNQQNVDSGIGLKHI